MEWLRENFFWLVVAGLFIWMHLKMHGGHGGHSGHGEHGGHGGGGGRDSGRDPVSGANSDEEGRHAEH